MRFITAIFFLIIFSCQALPVKAIGKLLAKNQTEEVKDDCCDEGDDTPDTEKEEKYNDLYCYHDQVTPVTVVSTTRKVTVFHTSDHLPDMHVKDIHCPPPNC